MPSLTSHVTPPRDEQCHDQSSDRIASDMLISTANLYPTVEGNAAMDLSNQDRLENSGLHDAMDLLGSIGSDIRDIEMAPGSGDFDWDRSFKELPDRWKGSR